MILLGPVHCRMSKRQSTISELFSRKRASTSTDTNADDEVVVIDNFESQAESDEVSSEITVGQVVVNVSEELEAGADNSVPDLDLVPAVRTPVVIVDDQDPEVPEQLGIAVEPPAQGSNRDTARNLYRLTKKKKIHSAQFIEQKLKEFPLLRQEWIEIDGIKKKHFFCYVCRKAYGKIPPNQLWKFASGFPDGRKLEQQYLKEHFETHSYLTMALNMQSKLTNSERYFSWIKEIKANQRHSLDTNSTIHALSAIKYHTSKTLSNGVVEKTPKEYERCYKWSYKCSEFRLIK